MVKFEEIISKFDVEGEITEVKPLSGGTVNHTYEIVCGGEHYVLQEMNHFVFKYPTEIMNNLFQVTEYLRDVIEREGRNPDIETITFIHTKTGNQLLQTETGNYFRLYRMIRYGEVMNKPQTEAEAYEAGNAIGMFQRRLRDFDRKKLSYTVPQIHDFKNLMRHLLDAVRADICCRASDCQEQIQFVLDRSNQMTKITEAVASGEIPLRVTHNDAHYSNILVDTDSKRAMCIIDLDTVMAGPSILDFGEAVRAGAPTYTEEEKSGDIELDLNLFRGYLHGYCHEMERILTPKEKELLCYSVWLMAMEQGARYLIDYLSGNYSATSFTDEREYLFRAVNQFYLVLDIEEKMSVMEAIVAEDFAKHNS